MTTFPQTAPSSTPASGVQTSRVHLRSLVWLVWMLALTLSFVGFAAASLDTFRPVSADEVATLAVSSKLADQGVLGSDLYRGFFNGDRHFFMSLPAQHVWQALVFRLTGADIAQARWVSMVFAIVLLWTLGWLAWRWYDLPTAFVATALLLMWRSDLLDIYPGLPYLSVARSARPDITVLTWVWLTFAAISLVAQRTGGERLQAGGRWRAAVPLVVGLCAGVATLTHFVGFFVVPLAALAWLALRRRWMGASLPLSVRDAGWMAAGFLALILPYLAWIGLNWADYRGQMARYGDLAAFGGSAFWLESLASEAGRFRPLIQGLQNWGNPYRAYIGPTLLLAVLLPSFGYLLFRLRRYGGLGDWLLFGSLATFTILLALLEQTKAPLYSLLLWPSLCLMTALMLVALFRWALHGPGLWPVRLGAGVAVLGFLALVAWDGREAYRTDWDQMGQVTSYRSLGSQIGDAIPPQSPVLADQRWWWALHDHPYESLNTLFFRVRAAYAQTNRLPDQDQWLDGLTPAYVLTNNNFAGARFDYPPGFREQFWDWLAACTTLEKQWDDRTYGRIDLYRHESERPGCAALTSPDP